MEHFVNLRVLVAYAEKQTIFDCICFSSILEIVKKSKISTISGVAFPYFLTFRSRLNIGMLENWNIIFF